MMLLALLTWYSETVNIGLPVPFKVVHRIAKLTSRLDHSPAIVDTVDSSVDARPDSNAVDLIGGQSTLDDLVTVLDWKTKCLW